MKKPNKKLKRKNNNYKEKYKGEAILFPLFCLIPQRIIKWTNTSSLLLEVERDEQKNLD